MKKHGKTRLLLNTETIRSLSSIDLDKVAGGELPNSRPKTACDGVCGITDPTH